MTEQLETAIDDAPEMVADNESVETEAPEVEGQEVETESTETDDVGFPKKAVNAINRRNKQIIKLRAQMRDLEAKLNQVPEASDMKEINPENHENYGDYIKEVIKASVENQAQQSQAELQKQQLTRQQQQLEAERNQYIIEQAQEASQTFRDLPQVWQQNAALLDALPKEVEDIFYSIDNAPAAVYMLAKEGKLNDLMYANPAIAAYEIVNAQNRGLELLSKTQKQRVSNAPQPISKARGTGSVKKQLSPNDDVLKSLGLKR